MTRGTCNTKACRFKTNFSLYIFLLVISSGSIALFINTFQIPNIQQHAITDKTFGKAYRDQRHYSPSCSPLVTSKLWPHLPNASRLRRIFLSCNWKTWNSASGYILHWQMPLVICIFNHQLTINKRKPYRSFPVVPDTISNENRCYFDVIDTWAAGYCDVILTDHSNAVSLDAFIAMALPARDVSTRRFIVAVFRSVLLRFRGRIEIDHSYGLRCRGLCCLSGTALVRPVGTNHSSADRIVVNSYNNQ